MGTGGGNTPLVLVTEVFVQTRHAEYHTGLPLLKASGGDTGGVMKDLSCYAIDSHPMDSRIQIAGDICPSVTTKLAKMASDGPLVLIEQPIQKIVWNSSGNGIAAPIDASYFKGCGLRAGIEREIVLIIND